MKLVIYHGHAMTHKLLDKSAVRLMTKANPNHRLDTDGGSLVHLQDIQKGPYQLKHLNFEVGQVNSTCGCQYCQH